MQEWVRRNLTLPIKSQGEAPPNPFCPSNEVGDLCPVRIPGDGDLESAFGRGLPVGGLVHGAAHLIEPPTGAGGATPVRAHRASALEGAIQSHFKLSAFHDSSFFCA